MTLYQSYSNYVDWLKNVHCFFSYVDKGESCKGDNPCKFGCLVRRVFFLDSEMCMACFSYVDIRNLVRVTTLAHVVVLLVEFSPLILSRFLRRF